MSFKAAIRQIRFEFAFFKNSWLDTEGQKTALFQNIGKMNETPNTHGTHHPKTPRLSL
jgi:hypothetical protein